MAFAVKGSYDPSPQNPLGALVSRDLNGRISMTRAVELGTYKTTLSPVEEEIFAVSRQKWDFLERNIPTKQPQSALETVADVRVYPLLRFIHWDQTTEASDNHYPCYNLYTPSNYYSGCTATAMSQVLYYHVKYRDKNPTTPVGTPTFSIFVDDEPEDRDLRGGDGMGGAYDWANMIGGPWVTQAVQRRAIGALLHDTGVSVGMNYTGTGSGAYVETTADSFMDTFSYGNAIWADNFGNDLAPGKRNIMTNSNLDAGLPVLYSIYRVDPDSGEWFGHTVVGDGYGYDNGTLYHHLNMGWSGSGDSWYSLPTIDVSEEQTYTVINAMAYNIYPYGTGEIVSGRVTDSNGIPIR